MNVSLKKKRKGIVLAGGNGKRLYPLTFAISKQLLPVYDKPMIFYPISVLMLLGIQEILIVMNPENEKNFKNLLQSGSQFGVKFEYLVQNEPKGIAHALVLAEDFIKNDNIALILGDNIFYGHNFSNILKNANRNDDATIFVYEIKDPQRFGVIEFDENGNPLRIVEKPKHPKSNKIVTGLYLYSNCAISYAKGLIPSQRGELEITDLNNIYIREKKMNIAHLGRGFSWLDTGTVCNLLQAGEYIKTIELNQGIKIAVLEEIALNQGFLSKEQIKKNISKFKNIDYYDYILELVENYTI